MLTPKQERFAQFIADGMSQADAYRNAFEVSASSKPETAQANASRLMANSTVTARVETLKNQLAEMALWTRADSVGVLSNIAKGNEDDAKASDRVAAVKELNAMHGFNAAQKVDHMSSDGTMSMQPTRIELVAPKRTNELDSAD